MSVCDHRFFVRCEIKESESNSGHQTTLLADNEQYIKGAWMKS